MFRTRASQSALLAHQTPVRLAKLGTLSKTVRVSFATVNTLIARLAIRQFAQLVRVDTFWKTIHAISAIRDSQTVLLVIHFIAMPVRLATL